MQVAYVNQQEPVGNRNKCFSEYLIIYTNEDKIREMFRALEGFYNSNTDFKVAQETEFTPNNFILSATSGLPGFADAISTASTYNISYQDPAVPNPDQIFKTDVSPELAAMSAKCVSGSIDDLLRDKNKDRIGCGWLYTRPNENSPYPIVSQGFLGTKEGPIQSLNPPSYKQWFFNLQEAKKQTLIDKCKALKACTEVDSAVFNGVCAFCTDTNEGVPIDTVGRPLYNNASCTDSSLIANKGQCPQPVIDGPQPIIDRTCEPIDGRLSLACLHRTVLSAGCSENGALAIALAGSQQSVDNLTNSDAVKLYNRVANQPINMDIFRNGNTTVKTVLNTVRQVAGNTQHPLNTAIGAAARDLCIYRGVSNSYDSCSELSDASTGPFELKCLQTFFLKMGGNGQGSAYPTLANKSQYDSMVTLGAIKQYWGKLVADMKGEGFVDYATQSAALTKMIGIVPEDMIIRAPYKQGVEVFWFVPLPGNPRVITGFLKRTIEKRIVQFQDGPSNVPQIGGLPFGCMLQLTDIRAPVDFSVKFEVRVDDGFWVAVAQPANIDKTAMNQGTADQPGLFENLGMQGPTTYQSNACTPFHSNLPNITKLYHEDAGGGWAAFTFRAIACSGTPKLDYKYLSLTCEARAPFLTYEVSPSSLFEELRNPGLFGQFLRLVGLDYRVRSDEKNGVPGKKGFVRVNSANSCIDMYSIAFQSWKTMTVAIRFVSMPVKESLINLACGKYYFNVIATNNGTSGAITIETNINGNDQIINTYNQIPINTWYLFRIDNLGTGFSLAFDTIASIIQNKGRLNALTVNTRTQLWSKNATYNPAPGQTAERCTIMFSTNGFMGRGDWKGYYSTSAFNYDVAWIHFFDGVANDNDNYREAMVNWKYTQFPSSYNKY